MAKKRAKGRLAAAHTVTFDRAARLCRLLRILGAGAETRQSLIRRLKLDVRGFYRDLELLRRAGIAVPLSPGRYRLQKPLGVVLPLVPCPDPGLTLGEVMELAQGKTKTHTKLRKQIARVTK